MKENLEADFNKASAEDQEIMAGLSPVDRELRERGAVNARKAIVGMCEKAQAQFRENKNDPEVSRSREQIVGIIKQDVMIRVKENIELNTQQLYAVGDTLTAILAFEYSVKEDVESAPSKKEVAANRLMRENSLNQLATFINSCEKV